MATDPRASAALPTLLGFDAGVTMADRMRAHAGGGAHLYAELMRAMAADWESGGVVREICRGWEDAPRGSVVQLRLLAGLFRIVLTDRAPELVGFYSCLGGQEPAADAWPAVRDVLRAHVEELHEALEIAPQTNEVGRSAALLVAVFDAVRRSGLSKVRLLEPGASAGLNLLVDRFRFVDRGWSFGPRDSPVVIVDSVIGHVEPVRFEVVERRGCDLFPVDPLSPQGRLRLRSFVWPFHVERHERLSGALRVAAREPVHVDAAPAGEWLDGQLTAGVPDDVLTVVWQSITQQYWPAAETARVRTAVSEAGRGGRVVHASMEYPQRAGEAAAELVVSGPGSFSTRRLGIVADHGIPVTLEAGHR